MVFYSSGSGGGTSLTTQQLEAITTASRWQVYTTDPEGVAVPTGKLRAVFGDKTYVDEGGVWALDETDQNHTYQRIAGNAPAGLPTGLPIGEDAEDGDTATYEYDDIEINLDRQAGAWVEINRETKATGGGGVAPTIFHSADSVLSLPVAPYHTQIHVIDSSRAATGNDNGRDYVEHTLVNPTAANQWVIVEREGDTDILVSGLINGDPTGIYHNLDGAQIRLYSGDGTGGWTLFADKKAA